MTAGKGERQSGFTLIELLVTIAVVAILATVAVPNFQSMVARNQISTDFNKVLSVMHYAKSEAAKRRENITAVFVSDGNVWKIEIWIGSGEGAAECEGNEDCLRLATGSSTPVSIVTAPADGKIIFNALGRAASSCPVGNPCSVTLTHTNTKVNYVDMKINSLGNIYRL
ncbi:GspH/FimT family pseudopilin [Halomonas sp. RA08-2]|uniref:GspH/FimT family pseudopilin n=1 Tax=Halomonas sp. RA08-2 TaxID=3440842 RepID=UPI003EECD625